MKERKPKIEKMKKPREKMNPSSLLFVGLSLLLTVGFYFGLIIVQNLLLEDVTYKQVVVAKNTIPENTIITEENAPEYFTLKQINILDATEGCLSEVSGLYGQKARVDLYTGEEITLKDFENISAYTEDFKDPVEVSIKISDIADADGGKLREGDLVNLTMMFTNEQLGLTTSGQTSSIQTTTTESSTSLFESFESVTENTEESSVETSSVEEVNPAINVESDVTSATIATYRYDSWAQYVLEDLYVSKALDSSGVEIASTDTDSSASILIFVIEKENEADLNNALANCSALRISKVVD